MAKTQGMASLLRKAGQESKKNVVDRSKGLSVLSSSDNIYSILEYIESGWGLNMVLFPVQRFLVKLYYNLELDTKIPEDEYRRIRIRDLFTGDVKYTFSERDYLTYLHENGRCNIGEQDHERRDLVLSLGRRSGKTELSSVFASYEVYRLLNLYNPQAYYGLPNGNRIQIISVATDKDQAGILFNGVASHLAKCDYFSPYQANNTQSQVNFRTPYDIEKYGEIYRENGKFASFSGKASLRLTFKGATGKGLRGAGNIVIILDEFAHLLDTGPASAEEIYQAVVPSAAAFSPKHPDNKQLPIGPRESRVICISSPLGKAGKFHSIFEQAMKGGPGSENLLAVQAPTWEVNPTVPLSDLVREYHADPKSFMVEYGAEFSDQYSGWIERKEDLQACIEPDRRPLMIARPRVPHHMGIDLGLVNDGTCVCITHVEGDKIVLDYHEIWYAKKPWRESNPHLDGKFSVDYAKRLGSLERLDFEEISKWIQTLCKRFHIHNGIFDSWNGIPLEQSLSKAGLKQFTTEYFTQDQASKMYQNAKMLMYDEKLALYDYPLPEKMDKDSNNRHSPHISEMFSLKARRLSKNIVLVEAPKAPGAHDDFSDALVRSVWLASRRLSGEKFSAKGRFGVSYTSQGMSATSLLYRKIRRSGNTERVPLNRLNRHR